MCRSAMIISTVLSALTAAFVAPRSRPQVDATSALKSEGAWSVKTTKLWGRHLGRHDVPITRVAMNRGVEELWAVELPIHLDQAQATASGAAICIGLQTNGEAGGVVDTLELWHISKNGEPRRLDAIPCRPTPDTQARVPYIARLEVFDSQQIALLGLSHPRIRLFEGVSGTSSSGQAPIVQLPNTDAPSEYWSLYSLKESRFLREISPRTIFPLEPRYLRIIGVKPMLGGEAVLCAAVTSESLSHSGAFGLSVAVLDSSWRPVWQVWAPERWDGRPSEEYASIGGSASSVRLATEASAANAEFMIQFSEDTDFVRYSVELAANPHAALAVREPRR